MSGTSTLKNKDPYGVPATLSMLNGAVTYANPGVQGVKKSNMPSIYGTNNLTDEQMYGTGFTGTIKKLIHDNAEKNRQPTLQDASMEALRRQLDNELRLRSSSTMSGTGEGFASAGQILLGPG